MGLGSYYLTPYPYGGFMWIKIVIQVVIALPGLIKALFDSYKALKCIGDVCPVEVAQDAKEQIKAANEQIKATGAALKGKAQEIRKAAKVAKKAVVADEQKKVSDLTASAKLIETDAKELVDKLRGPKL